MLYVKWDSQGWSGLNEFIALCDVLYLSKYIFFLNSTVMVNQCVLVAQVRCRRSVVHFQGMLSRFIVSQSLTRLALVLTPLEWQLTCCV